MRHFATLMGMLLLAVAVASTACSQGAPPTATTSPSDPNSPVDTGVAINGPDNAAPDFTLTDQFGQTVSLNQFRGKVVFLIFDDDECTTICPLTTQSLREMLKLLGPAASQVQLIGVNANPDATSVQDVATFSRDHGMMNQWHFLTGSKSQLEAVWKAYGIDDEVVNGSIDHTPANYLINQNGNERYLYLTSALYSVVGAQAEIWAKAVATLLPGHPAIATPQSNAQPMTLSPKDNVTLPALLPGSASVDLGPTSTHLLAFFASWAPDAAIGLQNLNVYEDQATTGQTNLPGVVAVDVGSVEVDQSKAPAFIDGLSSKPSYPIVLDQSGNVADAYQVQGIPWLALVKNGRVLWSHDGWLDPSSLLSQVQAALTNGPQPTP